MKQKVLDRLLIKLEKDVEVLYSKLEELTEKLDAVNLQNRKLNTEVSIMGKALENYACDADSAIEDIVDLKSGLEILKGLK